MASVMEYYGKIKNRCIAKPETDEERTKRRAAEIEVLKLALATFEKKTVLVVGGAKAALEKLREYYGDAAAALVQDDKFRSAGPSTRTSLNGVGTRKPQTHRWPP